MLRTKLSFNVTGADANEINHKGLKVICDFYKVDAQKIANDYDVDLSVTIDISSDGGYSFTGSFLVKPKSFAYNLPKLNLTN